MLIKYIEDGQWFITVTSRPKDWEQGTQVTVDDPLVTVEELVSVWENKFEGANYHSMTFVPENLVAVLRKYGVEDNVIRHVLFDIIESGGWIP